MNPVRIGLLGSTGRMGQWVTRLLNDEFASKAQIVTAPRQGESLASLLETDVVIDFALPEAMSALTELALKHGGPLPAFVVASTGWKPEQKTKLEALAQKAHVLQSSNFSTGVLALLEILRQATPVLTRLGYTPSVVETHHQHKKDAPSGTAIALQRAISPKDPTHVPTVSVRGGEIIGDHEVTFYGPGDHLTFGHFAQDRSIFARGAIEAALWIAELHASQSKPGGLLGADDFFKRAILRQPA